MSVLILGATSIARATAEEFAKKGESIYLAARKVDEIERIASDIHIRFGVKVNFGAFDAFRAR